MSDYSDNDSDQDDSIPDNDNHANVDDINIVISRLISAITEVQTVLGFDIASLSEISDIVRRFDFDTSRAIAYFLDNKIAPAAPAAAPIVSTEWKIPKNLIEPTYYHAAQPALEVYNTLFGTTLSGDHEGYLIAETPSGTLRIQSDGAFVMLEPSDPKQSAITYLSETFDSLRAYLSVELQPGIPAVLAIPAKDKEEEHHVRQEQPEPARKKTCWEMPEFSRESMSSSTERAIMQALFEEQESIRLKEQEADIQRLEEEALTMQLLADENREKQIILDNKT